jgi:acyl carrier protein
MRDPMTTAEIEAALIEAIRACLEASGRPAAELTPDTVPLDDSTGLDSLCVVEILVELESRLGLKADNDVFTDGEGANARKRTIRQIAEAMNQ